MEAFVKALQNKEGVENDLRRSKKGSKEEIKAARKPAE